MPWVRYTDRAFRSPQKQALVQPITEIIDSYAAQGYRLNPRGIAYRLEGQGIITKTERTFQLVEDVVGEGRDMGLFDWDAVAVDSARDLRDYAISVQPMAPILPCRHIPTRPLPRRRGLRRSCGGRRLPVLEHRKWGPGAASRPPAPRRPRCSGSTPRSGFWLGWS